MSRRKTVLVLMVSAVLFLLSPRLKAQFATPSVDGVIQSGEYGSNNSFYNSNTQQTWYMTWDDTNLYVAVTNANLGEAAVIYIDPSPIFPVNGGTNANGNLSGFNYDGEDFAELPFRAGFVTYFKDGYREYRLADGSGNWTGSTANFGVYASGAGNVRELAIPWAAITNGGGRPASFLFFGFLTSSGGYIYGQAPADNPGAFVGTSAAAAHYFTVNSTGDGTSTPPFSIESYTNLSGINLGALKHDTFDPFYRSLEGSVPEGTQVTLNFRTAHFDVDQVFLRAYLFDTGTGTTTGPIDTQMSFLENITENSTTYDVWTTTQTMPSAPTVFYYKFRIVKGSNEAFYSDDYLDDNDNLNKDGIGTASNSEPFDSFQITVYHPNFQTPTWLQNANVYQIMPDRFRNGDPTNDYCVAGSTTGCPVFYGVPNSAIAYTTWNTAICDPRNSSSSCYNNFNQFYGGDLLGIQNELDYLQTLGADTLYLTPIFRARSYHRYDTDNYLHIDPALGGDSAFAALQTEMDRRGMRLILDGVFNHASSDSLYFDRYNRYGGSPPNIGACLSLESMWRTWFHFNDNNVPCTSADYPGWFGFDSLPQFDHTNPQVQGFFYSGVGNVMQNWYNLGASGWRFDVAPDPNFPHAWWVGTRTFAKGYKSDGPLIGEIWPNASQWLAGDQLDSTMNYRFRKNITGFARNAEWHDDNNNGTNDIPGLTPSQFDHALRAVRDDYPPQATAAMLDLIDSHDTNRALYLMTELGDTGLMQAKQRLELAALFQFTYVGAPMVMYGDEVAINSPSLASSSNGPIGDPYTRAPYPWTDQSGDPTIYGPPDTSVESYYTLLEHLRKQYPVLRTGSFTTLLTGDTQEPGTAPNTYAFARSGGGSTAIVALNNGSSSNAPAISVGAFFPDGTVLQDALRGGTYAVSSGNVPLTLAGLSGVVLLPSPVSVDLTPPTASASLSPSADSHGWNNTVPVNVSVSATDNSGGSGVNELRYWVNGGPTTVTPSASASLSFNSEGQSTVYVRALDNAGNISSLLSQPVNIDLTVPVVRVTGVINGASYDFNMAPAAGCNTTDALSGVAVQATVNITGGNGHGYGNYTATCSGAVDNAGNAAASVFASYTVLAPPSLSGLITGKTGSRNARSWTITLKDSGSGPAGAAQVNSLSLLQAGGASCTPAIASTFPISVGSIASGSSANGVVTINFTGCANNARFTARFTFSSDNGAVAGSQTLYNQFQ
ncbi:MAG TPA: alpha-amylase family glycosyl hydrolase [Terriglobia bacterium]|nr:alpha-amylase family glycosyl hydrolase [Terriglobia bacterium]